MPPIPSMADTIQLFVGTWGAGKAESGSNILSLVDFPTLPGQTGPVQFTPADVGCPVMIVGAGPVDALTPPIFQVQGSTFVSVITAYISPTSVELADNVVTSYYNSGFRNICVFRECGMLVDSFTWQSQITQSTRDSFQFTALQSDPYFDRNQVMLLGQPILVRSTDSAVGNIFGGLIDSLDVTNQVQPSASGGLVPATNPAGTQPFAYIATCASWNSIPSRRRVQAQFATTYTGTADVVMRKMGLTNLSDEGVSFSGPTGPTITIEVQAGAVVQDVMDQIATAAGDASEAWYWKFDEFRNCTFAPASEVAAPWDVDDSIGSDDNVLVAVTKTTSHDQLYNRVYGLGSAVLLGSVTTTFNGPATSPYQCPTALQAPPTITLNGIGQTVGIAGVDTGKDFYWSQATAAISGLDLSSGDVLVVVFQPTASAVAVAYNNAGLQEAAVVEGPGSIYESVIQVTTPIGPADLYNEAQQLALQNGIPPVSVMASTVRGGLKTGQLQHIRLADVDVDDDFLITSVKLTSSDNLLVWQYTALTGYAVPTWLTAFTQFINRGKTTLANLSAASVPITVAPTPAGGNYASGLAGEGGSPPLAFPSTVNVGDLLVVVVARNNLPAGGVTDSLGNTYTREIIAANPGSFANVAAIYYTISQAAGACSVTCAASLFIAIAAISGIDPNNPVDTSASQSGSAPTLTTALDNNVVVTGMCMDSSTSVPTATAPEIVFACSLGGGPASDCAGALEVVATAGSFTSTLASAAGAPIYVSVSFNRAPASSPPTPSTSVVGNPMGTVTHSTGALTANLPILGNGGGDIKPGVAGQLVPPGGTTGQVLGKTSGTDFDTSWQNTANASHSEALTDGNSNFIFAAGDIVTVVGVPN